MFDNNGVRKFACYTCGMYKYKDAECVLCSEPAKLVCNNCSQEVVNHNQALCDLAGAKRFEKFEARNSFIIDNTK